MLKFTIDTTSEYFNTNNPIVWDFIIDMVEMSDATYEEIFKRTDILKELDLESVEAFQKDTDYYIDLYCDINIATLEVVEVVAKCNEKEYTISLTEEEKNFLIEDYKRKLEKLDLRVWKFVPLNFKPANTLYFLDVEDYFKYFEERNYRFSEHEKNRVRENQGNGQYCLASTSLGELVRADVERPMTNYTSL